MEARLQGKSTEKSRGDLLKISHHPSKSLTVLDFLIRYGSESVIAYSKENLYVIKTLKEFQYIDEDGRDQGANGKKITIHLF